MCAQCESEAGPRRTTMAKEAARRYGRAMNVATMTSHTYTECAVLWADARYFLKLARTHAPSTGLILDMAPVSDWPS